MAWRAAQAEGAAGTVADQRLAGEGDLGRTPGRLPGAGSDRRATVEAVVTQLAEQGVRQHAAQGACRPGEGQDVAIAAHGRPARPGPLEEAQVIGIMDAFDRRAAEVARREHLTEALLAHARQHMVGPRRHLETGFELPVNDFTATVVQVMVIAIDRAHAWPSACGSCILGRSRTAGK